MDKRKKLLIKYCRYNNIEIKASPVGDYTIF